MKTSKTREAIRMAIETLRTNKLRSGLSMLGIMIGVTTVLLISSVITGLTANVDAIVQSLGSNVYFIFRYPVFGGRPTSEMLAGRQLTYGDGMAMKNLPHVVAVSPSQQYRTPSGHIGDFSMKYQGRKVQNTILEGVGEDNPKVNDVDLQEGRYFTSEEELRHTNVVILGHDAAEELLDTASAIGSGQVFTVAGVLPRRDYF